MDLLDFTWLCCNNVALTDEELAQVLLDVKLVGRYYILYLPALRETVLKHTR